MIESARIYHAACLIGSGQTQLADEPLRAAIRQNPQMKPPDSLVFPPQVIDRFLRVRETMFDVIRKAEDERVKAAQEARKAARARAKRERARVAGLERLAQEETMITPRTRWLALVPFGVGQFQNQDKSLGYVFLTSEILLAATTLTALGVETHLVLRYQPSRQPRPQQQSSQRQLEDRARLFLVRLARGVIDRHSRGAAFVRARAAAGSEARPAAGAASGEAVAARDAERRARAGRRSVRRQRPVLSYAQPRFSIAAT